MRFTSTWSIQVINVVLLLICLNPGLDFLIDVFLTLIFLELVKGIECSIDDVQVVSPSVHVFRKVTPHDPFEPHD